jgi:Resolvase, N terminal domain
VDTSERLMAVPLRLQPFVQVLEIRLQVLPVLVLGNPIHTHRCVCTLTVVVWKLDRLGRSLQEGVSVLADWCQRGVRIIAITQQIDLSGPMGHLIASLLFGIAEIELQHAKERQAAGIALAKQRGVYTGRRQGTTKAAQGFFSLQKQ